MPYAWDSLVFQLISHLFHTPKLKNRKYFVENFKWITYFPIFRKIIFWTSLNAFVIQSHCNNMRWWHQKQTISHALIVLDFYTFKILVSPFHHVSLFLSRHSHEHSVLLSLSIRDELSHFHFQKLYYLFYLLMHQQIIRKERN